MADPLAGWQKLAPGDMVAQGLVNKGPLTGWVQSTNPETNAQAMRDRINPEPQAAPAQPNWFQRTIGATPLGKIGPAPAALAVPGAGSLLGRVGLQAAAGGAEKLAQGGGLAQAGKAALGGAAGALGGEALGKAAGYLGSAIPYNALAKRTGRSLAAYLKAEVPAWSGYKGNVQGLYEMAHGEGKNALDAMFKKAKSLIPESAQTEVPVAVAKAAGISGMRTPVPPAGRGEEEILVSVPTRQLTDKLAVLRDKSTKTLGNYHRVAWNAIDRSLEGVPNAELQAARKAYRVGSGWMEFAQKGKFLSPDSLDLVQAQKAFREYGQKSLLGRGMRPARQAIMPEGATQIRRQQPNSFGWHLGLGGAGLLGGLGLGLPMHGAPGAIGALMPRPSFYTGLPSGPLGRAAQATLGRGGALAGEKLAE